LFLLNNYPIKIEANRNIKLTDSVAENLHSLGLFASIYYTKKATLIGLRLCLSTSVVFKNGFLSMSVNYVQKRYFLINSK